MKKLIAQIKKEMEDDLASIKSSDSSDHHEGGEDEQMEEENTEQAANPSLIKTTATDEKPQSAKSETQTPVKEELAPVI